MSWRRSCERKGRVLGRRDGPILFLYMMLLLGLMVGSVGALVKEGDITEDTVPGGGSIHDDFSPPAVVDAHSDGTGFWGTGGGDTTSGLGYLLAATALPSHSTPDFRDVPSTLPYSGSTTVTIKIRSANQFDQMYIFYHCFGQNRSIHPSHGVLDDLRTTTPVPADLSKITSVDPVLVGNRWVVSHSWNITTRDPDGCYEGSVVFTVRIRKHNTTDWSPSKTAVSEISSTAPPTTTTTLPPTTTTTTTLPPTTTTTTTTTTPPTTTTTTTLPPTTTTTTTTAPPTTTTTTTTLPPTTTTTTTLPPTTTTTTTAPPADGGTQSQLGLSDFDREGLEVEALALFTAGDAGSAPALYSASGARWTASGSLLAGDAAIGPDQEAIARIMYVMSEQGNPTLRLNDGGPLVLGDYFGSGGAGHDLTVWVQTAGGTTSFAASSYRLAGANYINFGLSSQTADLITDITAGDRFILALTRPGPELTISRDQESVTEGETAQFTITSDRAVSTDLTVKTYQSQNGGFATLTGPGTVTMPEGSTSARAAIETVEDSTDEANGLLTMTLKDGTGYRVDSTASAASVKVIDNYCDIFGCEAPQPKVNAVFVDQSSVTEGHQSSVTEGDYAYFQIAANQAVPATLTVNYSRSQEGSYVTQFNNWSGTGTLTIFQGNFRSNKLGVATVDDGEDEKNGWLKITVEGGDGYTVGSSPTAKVTVNATSCDVVKSKTKAGKITVNERRYKLGTFQGTFRSFDIPIPEIDLSWESCKSFGNNLRDNLKTNIVKNITKVASLPIPVCLAGFWGYDSCVKVANWNDLANRCIKSGVEDAVERGLRNLEGGSTDEVDGPEKPCEAAYNDDDPPTISVKAWIDSLDEGCCFGNRYFFILKVDPKPPVYYGAIDVNVQITSNGNWLKESPLPLCGSAATNDTLIFHWTTTG